MTNKNMEELAMHRLLGKTYADENVGISATGWENFHSFSTARTIAAKFNIWIKMWKQQHKTIDEIEKMGGDGGF